MVSRLALLFLVDRGVLSPLLRRTGIQTSFSLMVAFLVALLCAHQFSEFGLDLPIVVTDILESHLSKELSCMN